MVLFFFFNRSSIALIVMILLIGLIVGGSNFRKGLLVSRDISIPLGLVAMIIGCGNILSYLGNISSIGPAIAISLLNLLYALVLFSLLEVIGSHFPEQKTEHMEHIETEITSFLTRGSIGSIVLIIICIGLSIQGVSLSFFNIPSLICLLLFVIIPTFSR